MKGTADIFLGIIHYHTISILMYNPLSICVVILRLPIKIHSIVSLRSHRGTSFSLSFSAMRPLALLYFCSFCLCILLMPIHLNLTISFDKILNTKENPTKCVSLSLPSLYFALLTPAPSRSAIPLIGNSKQTNALQRLWPTRRAWPWSYQLFVIDE